MQYEVILTSSTPARGNFKWIRKENIALNDQNSLKPCSFTPFLFATQKTCCPKQIHEARCLVTECKLTHVGILEICLNTQEASDLVQTIGYKTDKQDVNHITKKVILVTDHSLMLQEQLADINTQRWCSTSSLMNPSRHSYLC